MFWLSNIFFLFLTLNYKGMFEKINGIAFLQCNLFPRRIN